MPRLGTAALVLLVAASLALAACGGDDTEEANDYVDQVNQVTSTLQSGLGEVASGANVNSPDKAAAVFEGFAGQIDAAVSDLEGITAPEDVAELQDQIVEDLQTLEDEATGVANEIRDGGAAAIPGVAAGFLSEASRLGAEIDKAIGEINSKLQE
jgi:ABC-type transporter Mla subunit MlaD